MATSAQAALKKAEQQLKAGTLKLGVQSNNSEVTKAARNASGNFDTSLGSNTNHFHSDGSKKSSKKNKSKTKKSYAPAPSVAELTQLAKGRADRINSDPKEKGFFTNQISTLGGIAGGVVGSLGGPAGTIAGAGLGAGLGESVENVITGDSLGKGVVKEGLIGSAFAGAGIGVVKLGLGIAKKVGMKLALRGSSKISKQVAQASAGKLPKGVTQKMVKGAIARIQANEIAVNSVNAMKTESWLTKLVISAKSHPGTTALATIGGTMGIVKFINEMIGTYNFGGFIKEEALQTVGFASSQSLREAMKNPELLTEEDSKFIEDSLLIEREILEPKIWTGIIDATPQKQVADSLQEFNKAAMLAWEGKTKEFDKLVAGLNAPDELSDPSETPSQNSEKWITGEDGKFAPNLDNPRWETINGRNVYK